VRAAAFSRARKEPISIKWCSSVGHGNDGGVLVNADLDRALQVAQLQREGRASMMSEASPSATAGRDAPSDLRPLGAGLAGHGAVHAGVLDRHDRFRRVGHPEVGNADTHTRLSGRSGV